MNSSVAGASVTETLIKRMEQARLSSGEDKNQASKNQAEEGIRITVELIQKVQDIRSVRGVHIQAIEGDHRLPEIVERAGFCPRPTITEKGKNNASESENSCG